MLKNILKNVKRPPIHFPTLKKPRKPNNYLMAPAGLCSHDVDMESPVFDTPKEKLAKAFEDAILSLPNTEKVDGQKPDGLQTDYVQYSRLIGFPDTLTVDFLDAGEGKSTLAVFSRAHYGYRDFGVNSKRVRTCVEMLRHRL